MQTMAPVWKKRHLPERNQVYELITLNLYPSIEIARMISGRAGIGGYPLEKILVLKNFPC
jgi:hypothetical protein